MYTSFMCARFCIEIFDDVNNFDDQRVRVVNYFTD